MSLGYLHQLEQPCIRWLALSVYLVAVDFPVSQLSCHPRTPAPTLRIYILSIIKSTGLSYSGQADTYDREDALDEVVASCC